MPLLAVRFILTVLLVRVGDEDLPKLPKIKVIWYTTLYRLVCS
jgi:hypothetical protein